MEPDIATVTDDISNNSVAKVKTSFDLRNLFINVSPE